MKKKVGDFKTNGVKLEPHEVKTVMFFLELGKDIELIPPSNTPHAQRPDFIMDGLEWEMKSPKNICDIVVERAFHKALRQSCNVIIDLRETSTDNAAAIRHLYRCFEKSKRAKKLFVITNEKGLLTKRRR